MTDAFALIMTCLLGVLDWFRMILFSAGALPLYIAMFFIGVVLRLLIRPFIGESRGGSPGGD